MFAFLAEKKHSILINVTLFMNQEIDNCIKLLKAEIQTRFGRKILYAKDCRELAELIRYKTQRHISISTIKRFFGIIKNSFSASKYTLDTFSIFLEYEYWHQFQHKKEYPDYEITEKDTWEGLKKRTEKII